MEKKPLHGAVAGSNKSVGSRKSASADHRPSGKNASYARVSKDSGGGATHKNALRPPKH